MAAFDGSTLVVADSAELTVMSPKLDLGPTAFLTESCGSAVMVEEGNASSAVRQPTRNASSTTTYDVGANPPVKIAASAPFTYDGVPMSTVPGTNSFVTVTLDSEPASFEASSGRRRCRTGSPSAANHR